MLRPIEVFFEFASPYSYLAGPKLSQLAARYGRALRWRPVEIVEIWEAQGILEAQTAMRRAKVGYIMHDAARLADEQNTPFVPFRRLPDTALARLTAHRLNRAAPEAVETFAFATWRKLFAEGADVSRAETLAAGLPAWIGAHIEAAAADAQAASDLAAANAAAIASRCFGIPWVVADGETFFGQDRLGLLGRHLAQEVVTA